MPNYSTSYMLGDISLWGTTYPCTVYIPQQAHPVGVIATWKHADTYSIQLICVENIPSSTPASRRFVITNQSVSAESIMFIGSVQLQKPHTHQVDVGQTVLYDNPNDPDNRNNHHSHSHYSVTDNIVPEVATFLVFETSDL